MKTDTHYFHTNSGLIELELTLEQAESGSHQGQCDESVEQLSKDPAVSAQLDAIDPQLLAKELKEYGAWDTDELKDHNQNLQRLLWIACGDIKENAFNASN